MNNSEIFCKMLSTIFLLLFFGCQSEGNSTTTDTIDPPKREMITSPSPQKENLISEDDFLLNKSIFPKDRTEILKRLKQKIENSEPLVIHVFVPLCDNDNQGIVPVSRALGNGLNLKTNLYWGALYGVKTHFNKQKDWKFIFSKKDLDKNVLERVVFSKKYSNGALVYLVADAYRGDRMKACLNDYFDALSNTSKDDFTFENIKIGLGGNADLIVFNGHNGLMDTAVDFPKESHPVAKEAVTVACASFSYFEDYFKKVNAYPLLNTTNLLAPEAYVLEEVFDAWALLKDEKAIHHAAGSAYNKYQKCGLKGAKRLFKPGW